jgi:hypothetical protein
VIETTTAKNGSLVVRDGGRWLASAFDPQSEARTWLARRREFLDKVKCVFVLGAGSGYHIHALSTQTSADIVVIDTRIDLIEAVRTIHAFDSDRIKFVCVDSTRQLRAAESVRAGVAQSFVILQHGPSLASHPILFRELHAQLLGRDWGALNWQWKMMGLSTLESQPQIQKGADALTILDLEQAELIQDSTERERMLVKALRELVK